MRRARSGEFAARNSMPGEGAPVVIPARFIEDVETFKMNMELADIPGTSLKVSPVAIGTWAIGGWTWGGTDDAESVSTIRAKWEHGINIIDTAPVYGFGRSRRSLAGQSQRPACARTCLLPPRPDLNGRMEEYFATPAAPGSCARSRTPCAGFEPTTSISIKFTGPTHALKKAGVEEAEKRVFTSCIPIRS